MDQQEYESIEARQRLNNHIADYAPRYSMTPREYPGRPALDPDSNLQTRSLVLTDEGGYRVNFSGTDYAKPIGDVALENGHDIAEWQGDDLALHVGDYVWLIADGPSYAVQVSQYSEQVIILAEPYAGATATGPACRSVCKPVIGAGASAAVSAGVLTLTTGAVDGATVGFERDVDYLPIIKQAGILVSQRIAAQIITIGLVEPAAVPRWYAVFILDGAVNTSVKCRTARNSTGAPSGAEIEETSVIIPNGKTSALSLRYRVELTADRCSFYIDGIVVAVHYRSLPMPADSMKSVIIGTNTTGATSTNISVDYDTCQNFNELATRPSSDTTSQVATQPPMVQTNFSQAGVIAINTILMVFDCSQHRALMIQCIAMGTTGVITPEWSNDGTNWAAATVTTPAGAAATTLTAAGLWTANVRARYLRLRLSTATTAGTTTLSVQAAQQAIEGKETQTVTGTVTVTSTTANVGTSAPTQYADTTTVLAASATFTGTSRDGGATPAFQRFAARAYADQAGTLKIQDSTDNTTWRDVLVQAVAAGETKSLECLCLARYYRVLYINGATLQGAFRLTSAYVRI